jgi:hypothetical protein
MIHTCDCDRARDVWRNRDLRRVELAYGLFKTAESGTWLARLG